jgi:hypothetical protein
MRSEIDWVIPVVHGWTTDELQLSVNLIEDPDRLGGTDGSTDKISSPSQVKTIATPNNADPPSTIVIDHLKSRRLAVGSFSSPSTVVIDHMKTRRLAVGSFNVTGTTNLAFTGGRTPRVTGHPQLATPGCTAEQVLQKAPKKVIWERLATVLNAFRDSELFILGGAGPHDLHMTFLGGARYSDTSSWRLKAYLGGVYVPERGDVYIGHKGDPKPTETDCKTLQECLRESTHPLCGMSLNRFLTIGKMTMNEWKATRAKHQWEIKPFDLRAAHNAWVLKYREEQIANDFACDPDAYHRYLLERRFKNRPNLTAKLNFLWTRFRRPYVQPSMDLFLKDSGPTSGSTQGRIPTPPAIAGAEAGKDQ